MTEEWTNKTGTELPKEFFQAIPKPSFWRLLIMPQAPEKVSKGGIVLTESNQEAQQYNTYVGKVVAMGPLVGQREPLNGAPLDIAIGDSIVYGKYAGQRVECLGVKLLILNDEDILGTAPQPDALTVKV